MLGFVQDSGRRMICHMMRCAAEHAGTVRADIMIAMATKRTAAVAAAAPTIVEEDGGFKAVADPYGDSTISFGVGLHKKVTTQHPPPTTAYTTPHTAAHRRTPPHTAAHRRTPPHTASHRPTPPTTTHHPPPTQHCTRLPSLSSIFVFLGFFWFLFL